MGRGNMGKTALFYAISRSRDETVRVLLRHGARTTIVNNKGQTPVSLAACYLEPETVKMIVDIERAQIKSKAYEPLWLNFRESDGDGKPHGNLDPRFIDEDNDPYGTQQLLRYPLLGKVPLPPPAYYLRTALVLLPTNTQRRARKVDVEDKRDIFEAEDGKVHAVCKEGAVKCDLKEDVVTESLSVCISPAVLTDSSVTSLQIAIQLVGRVRSFNLVNSSVNRKGAFEQLREEAGALVRDIALLSDGCDHEGSDAANSIGGIDAVVRLAEILADTKTIQVLHYVHINCRFLRTFVHFPPALCLLLQDAVRKRKCARGKNFSKRTQKQLLKVFSDAFSLEGLCLLHSIDWETVDCPSRSASLLATWVAKAMLSSDERLLSDMETALSSEFSEFSEFAVDEVHDEVQWNECLERKGSPTPNAPNSVVNLLNAERLCQKRWPRRLPSRVQDMVGAEVRRQAQLSLERKGGSHSHSQEVGQTKSAHGRKHEHDVSDCVVLPELLRNGMGMCAKAEKEACGGSDSLCGKGFCVRSVDNTRGSVGSYHAWKLIMGDDKSKNAGRVLEEKAMIEKVRDPWLPLRIPLDTVRYIACAEGAHAVQEDVKNMLAANNRY